MLSRRTGVDNSNVQLLLMSALLVNALSRSVLPLLVAVGALAACLLGYLGMLSAVFDLLAQFTAHWLAIAAMAVIASFWTRFAYGLIAAGIGIACLFPLALTSWYAAKPVSVATIAKTATPPGNNIAAPVARTRGSGQDGFVNRHAKLTPMEG